MNLGMLLTTSPEHQNSRTVVALARAALARGHEVSLFLMDDGVYNLVPGPRVKAAGWFAELARAGARLVVCALSMEERGVSKESVIEGVIFGNQYLHAQIVHGSDRFLTFS
ncbi:MAG: DsrE family protein [Deltaproteobacteria bacterium]|nr:DsrE family protein [Deltaproteobacteria bacterium]MBI3075483.1 DsrE family protein [Deltaproteobacteria bacterium]